MTDRAWAAKVEPTREAARPEAHDAGPATSSAARVAAVPPQLQPAFNRLPAFWRERYLKLPADAEQRLAEMPADVIERWVEAAEKTEPCDPGSFQAPSSGLERAGGRRRRGD